MNRAKLCGNDSPGKRISIVVLAALIGVGSATPLLAQTPILRDALQTDSDGNSKTNAGDRLRYTLTFTNTSGVTLTNVLISVPAITNTTLDGAATSASPLARDEGPIAASIPGNAFHTAFNTPLAVNDGDADEDLLNNDFLGASAAAIATFGGGTLGGAVSDNNAGATADPGGVGGHSLTVNANGSFTYTPSIGFAGLFTFQYRLANAAGSDTATVVIAVGERPGPVADARAVTGNVQIDTATGTAFSVLSNDDGDAVAINLNTAGTLGAVVMSANGQFVYTPPRGKATGTDTFSYTLSNGFGTSSPATVTLNFDGSIVWFIDASSGAGDGRSHSPYNTLAAFNTVNNGAVNNPADNNVIILRDGTYNNNVAGGALVLRAGQRVFGDGWSGAFDGTTAGFSLATHSVVAPFSGTDPLIQNSTAHGIALAAGNHIRGVTVGNTPNGFGFNGGDVGSPTLAESSKTGTGGAVNITTSGTFGSSVNFDTLESSSSTGHNLSLTNVTGTLGVASGGTGLAGSAVNSSAVNINGGSVSLTYPATVSKANAGSLVNVSGGHTGTLTFNTTMSATAGDGLQFNNADGIYNFNATVTLNGGDAGVDIINGSSGNFSFSDTDITGPSGAAFLVSTSAGGSIGHAGTITKNNAGRAVDIQGKTGGSVTFSGTIAQNNAASTGIFLNSNTGGTINFLGAISLTTGNNAAFTATGGGTVTATASGSTLTTTTGIALNVANTTIGASGLTFQSISANGAANGIVLNTTGTTAGTHGGLTVTGTGTTDGSGGTIQNTTGRGANVISARDITLKNMNFTSAGTTDLDADNSGLSTGDNLACNAAIHLQTVTTATLDNLNITGGAEMGINGNTVANFTLNNSSIVNAGNGPDEDNIHFFNMSGNSAITDTLLTQTTGDDNLNLQTQAGLLNLRISGGNAVGGGTQQGSGYLFGIRGTTVAAITLTNAVSTNNFSGGIVVDMFDSATNNLTVVNSTSRGNNDQISVSAGDNSRVELDVNGNTLGSIAAADFVVVSLLGSAFDNGFIFDARIRNNNITVANSLTADGIFVFNAGGGAMNMAITGNTIDYAGTQRAIVLQTGQDGAGAINATVTGNNIDIKLDGAGNAVAGILAQSGITSPTGNGSSICADIGGAGALSNTFTHSLGGALAAGDIRVRQRNNGTARLPGYAGGATDTAAVIAYLNGRNAEVSTSTATADSTGYAGGAACMQP